MNNKQEDQILQHLVADEDQFEELLAESIEISQNSCLTDRIKNALSNLPEEVAESVEVEQAGEFASDFDESYVKVIQVAQHYSQRVKIMQKIAERDQE